jgi:hypothetical protein
MRRWSTITHCTRFCSKPRYPSFVKLSRFVGFSSSITTLPTQLGLNATPPSYHTKQSYLQYNVLEIDIAVLLLAASSLNGVVQLASIGVVDSGRRIHHLPPILYGPWWGGEGLHLTPEARTPESEENICFSEITHPRHTSQPIRWNLT